MPDPMAHNTYTHRNLAVELAIEFVIMYFVMYTMVDSSAHLHLNLNTVDMTLMMVAPMIASSGGR